MLHTVISETHDNNHGRPMSYFRLDENGKQQFCVHFGSGVVQVIATEP